MKAPRQQPHPICAIDAGRLWSSILETARIGATAKGGINRLALTDLDRQVRDWFVAACREAGCTVTMDALGNIFARRPGRDDTLPPIAMGSHLDTQPTGGKFDGVIGVLAGLEVLRTLNDAGIETQAPIEVIDWTNEEGSRFAPAMLASGVFAGVFRRNTPMPARTATASASPRRWTASAIAARRHAAAASWARSSSCISNRGRSWRPRPKPSAW